MWPLDAESLKEAQRELARAEPSLWRPPVGDLRVGGCWVCFPRGLRGRGSAGDAAWVAAVVMRGDRLVAQEVRRGVAGAPYSPGLLALRLGPLMEEAVRALPTRPDVLLVDATARDHPRGLDSRSTSVRSWTCRQSASPTGRCSARGTGPRTVPAPPPRSGSTTPSSGAGCARGPASGRSQCTRGGGSISTLPLTSWAAPPGNAGPRSPCVARVGLPEKRASTMTTRVSVVASSVHVERMRGST